MSKKSPSKWSICTNAVNKGCQNLLKSCNPFFEILGRFNSTHIALPLMDPFLDCRGNPKGLEIVMDKKLLNTLC